jgi:HSP20 family protein
MRCSTRSARRPIVYTRSPFGTIVNEFMNTPVNDLVRESRVVKSKPAVNVVENTDAYVLSMAIPGYTKEMIDITVKEGFLKISSKDTGDKTGKFRVKEFDYSSFNRSFRLGKSIDLQSVNAKMEQGILSITLGKKEEQKPRTINII